MVAFVLLCLRLLAFASFRLLLLAFAQDPGLGTQDPGVEDSGLGTRASGIWTRDSGFGTQDSGLRTLLSLLFFVFLCFCRFL